jgi:hypothetical protein
VRWKDTQWRNIGNLLTRRYLGCWLNIIEFNYVDGSVYWITVNAKQGSQQHILCVAAKEYKYLQSAKRGAERVAKNYRKDRGEL